MIWIATLCLLAVIAWLFFNALNEQRWVEAHSHDETVAADKGILPDLSGVSARLRGDTDGTAPIDPENRPLARAVAKVRETGAKTGEKIGQLTAEARDPAKEGTLIGRAVAKVDSGVKSLDAKLDARATRRAAEGHDASTTDDGTFLRRAGAGVAKGQQRAEEYVRQRVAKAARADRQGRPPSEKG